MPHSQRRRVPRRCGRAAGGGSAPPPPDMLPPTGASIATPTAVLRMPRLRRRCALPHTCTAAMQPPMRSSATDGTPSNPQCPRGSGVCRVRKGNGASLAAEATPPQVPRPPPHPKPLPRDVLSISDLLCEGLAPGPRAQSSAFISAISCARITSPLTSTSHRRRMTACRLSSSRFSRSASIC